ncbi:MAG: POTRA domain-containing protein [Bryobacteraceae bacterium]
MRWIVGLITVVSVFAQQKKHAEPAPAVFPLEALHVEGNKKLTVEKILAVAGLKIGEPVIRTDFDDARKRLMATGAFQSVAYEFKPSMDAKGVDGLLRVVEVEYWFPYRFEDLPATDEALRAVLRKQELILDDRIPATKEVITRYTAAIEEFLGGKVEVTGKVMSDVPDQPAIVFRPPGARPNIAEVHFEGNEVLPTAALVNSLAPVAIGVPYSEATMQQLLDASTRSLYEGRGRVGVSFPKVLVEKASKVDGVSVTITVKEGPSYNMGSVKLTGVPPDEQDGIRNIAKWRAGDIADLEAVRTSAIKITDRLRNNGYLHATAKTDKTIHENDHTVDALITVTAGPQYHMGKLTIDGLDLLTEPQIRKVWSMKTGDPFRPDYPDQFLKDLRAQGVFENLGETRAEKTNDEKTHTVDVKLFFGVAKPKEKTGVKLPGGRGGIHQ